MTQEDKQLLLKVICAMLPYDVKCYDFYYDNSGNKVDDVYTLVTINPIHQTYKYVGSNNEHDISRIKPYLRPLSSMTEEERREYINITHAQNWLIIGEADKYIDWLNEHYFDYRNLIEKGLALEAPKGMYKTE